MAARTRSVTGIARLVASLACMCLMTGLFPTLVHADDESLKNFINDCQAHLDQTRDQVSNLETAYSPMGDFAAGDLVKMDHAYQPTIAAWEQALAAYQKGDAVKGEALRNAALKASPAIDWGRRLQYRQRMYYLDLNDRWVLANISWAREPAWKALGDWIEVKKKCSLAWGHAAESMADGTENHSAQGEIDAIEAAKATDVEEETAHWDFDIAKLIYNDLTHDEGVTSPELTNSIDAIRKLEKQRVALHLEDIEHDRKAREYERQMAQLQQEAHNAFDAARQARDKAAQNKH